MNISKRKQGILAIICTIAMIVTSITMYNPREVKADTDYSKLTYNYKNKGESYMKGSENTKSPWKVAIDESQSKGDIVNWMTTGAGNLNFYNDMFMNVTWHGNYPDATVEINSVKVEKEGKGVQAFNSAEIHVNAKEWINNNAYNVVKVTSKDGSQYVTFIVATGDKAGTSSEETTTPTPEYKDGEVLVNESNQTKEVPAYPDGDYWQNEYNNMPVKYVKGKKYVAEVVVSSTAAKKIKMVFQRVNIWDFVDANQGYETSIAAGNKVKITYVFEATQSTDNGNFDIYLGSVADKTTLVFESKKLTTYNEVPAGVQTGVEVIPSQTKYTVTEDGVAKEVTEGSSYTFGKNEQGYYDATNGVAYAPEEVITVDRNITVTGIKLNVAMESGAGIKLTTPTGLRFKTNVTGTTDILSHSNIIKTGTIITASDILDGGTVDDDFVKSNKLKLNIENENNGWYGNTAGTFCASIVELQEANYARDFVGVGYVTITYNNNKTKTIYAPSGTVRAVATVAQNIQNSKAIYQDGMTYYNYLKSKGYGTIIDTYAAAKKNNQ